MGDETQLFHVLSIALFWIPLLFDHWIRKGWLWIPCFIVTVLQVCGATKVNTNSLGSNVISIETGDFLP
jgi:hypothetical protein